MSPLFDPSIFGELKAEVGQTCILEILDGFWIDTDRAIRRMTDVGWSRAIVRHETHSIKSSAQLLGFARLSRLASALEADCADLDDARLTEGLREFRAVFEQTRSAAPPGC